VDNLDKTQSTAESELNKLPVSTRVFNIPPAKPSPDITQDYHTQATVWVSFSAKPEIAGFPFIAQLLPLVFQPITSHVSAGCDAT
jgi:hypothetical protein